MLLPASGPWPLATGHWTVGCGRCRGLTPSLRFSVDRGQPQPRLLRHIPFFNLQHVIGRKTSKKAVVTGNAMVLALPLPQPLHLPRPLSGSSPARARFVAPFVGPSSLGSFFVSLGQITKRSKNRISSNADDSDGKIQDEEQAEQDAAREGERVREDVFKSCLALAAGRSTDL